jgi:hypothetical protein
MTNEEILKTLQHLSKRTDFSIVEIAYIARMIVQAEYDPLPPEEWGEPFEFPQRGISVIGDEWDFDAINAEVPKPDAQVDLRVAWREAERDQRAIAAIFARHSDLPLGALWQIYNRLLEWERFWMVRHLAPEIRKASERNVQEIEAMMKGFGEKAKAILRRRGVFGQREVMRSAMQRGGRG